MIAAGWPAQGAADLYMKDTPADTGAEPNTNAGPMYVSEDIWVRQNPIPGYKPQPFGADPAWLTAISPLHQNPEYRDPKFSKPNYVYVRVRNRGGSASSGNERLRVYWAKASTGLSWPSQWVDYVATNCGPSNLYGIEITKPRKNAATASDAERAAYLSAVLGADTLKWTADMVSYFDKQDQIHQLAAQHGVPAFLPWHREMMNRYEILLRQTVPTVTLLYWDWTTDPANSTGGFNLMTTNFMGAANGDVGAPLTSLQASGVCTNARDGWLYPFSAGIACGTHTNDWTYPPPNLYRDKAAGQPLVNSDAMVLAPTNFPLFRDMEGDPHGASHGYLSGAQGNIGFVDAAAEDPFFFLLHCNCDRLWAMWQRTNNLSYLGRRDAATVYGTESKDSNITNSMPPWDGSTGIEPWTKTPGDYTYAKNCRDPSIVDAPVYDTAPLTIPSLKAAESCVIEIPWYPPSPDDFSCYGTDQGHVCLLARIETDTTSPYGMTFPEGTDVSSNTRSNNNIVWKNITIQDLWPGTLMIAPTWLRNISGSGTALTHISVRIPPEEQANSLFNFGTLLLKLGPVLYPRWVQNGSVGQGVVPGNDPNTVQVISPDAFVENIPLLAGEAQQIEAQFRLADGYPQPQPQGRVFHVDIEQTGTPGDPAHFIGGQRVEFNFNKLVLVSTGARWRYRDDGQFPGPAWTLINYDDSQWSSGAAELGYGDGDEATVIGSGPPGQHYITSWFRRSFTLDHPQLYRDLWLRLKRDDGAVVYLNGTEVYRVNLPGGPITAGTPALAAVEGLAEKIFYPVDLSFALPMLVPGANVIAVEVHQVSPASDDLSFDLELSANLGAAQFPPMIAFMQPTDGSLQRAGSNIALSAEAIDPDGAVASVSYYADEQLLGSSGQPPYAFVWTNPPAGTHQLAAVATDNGNLTASAFVSVQVLSNLPPSVTITNPVMETMYVSGTPISAGASASDPDGTVQMVTLYMRNHNLFTVPGQQVGTVNAPPFNFEFTAPSPGHYVLTAVATDDQGVFSQSEPVHIETIAHPLLSISFSQSMVRVDWVPPSATLLEAAALNGQWQVVSNAVPPLLIPPQGGPLFFRVRSP